MVSGTGNMMYMQRSEINERPVSGKQAGWGCVGRFLQLFCRPRRPPYRGIVEIIVGNGEH
jgi:hypothetical protein